VADEVGRFVDEGWRLRRDGTRFWANVTITALRDAGGTLLGFAKLTRDLTEAKRAQAAEQASQAREQLFEAERTARMSAQRATRVKDEFLATLSHELRTALSSILGWTQVLLRTGDAELPERQRHALEVIDRNARAQVRLIDDLLDLSRIMAGKVRLEMQDVCLDGLVGAAIESALPAAHAKDLRLEARLGAPPVTLRGDPARLQQVVWNLLTNALKFTPRSGHVEVALERPGDHVLLRVRDDGIGIPAAFLPQVFDRFSQRDSSSTRAFGGLGLGLAITRELVELHGGSIAVESAGEGHGALFTVTLPMDGGAAATQAADAVSPGDVADELRALPQLRGIRLFLVDDEQDARDLLAHVFTDQGAYVSAFGSAEEALEALAGNRPDLIVSDIGMPHMDGLQFMRQLRAVEARGERIPALALTAFARAEDRKRALLAGYQAHVAKPFDMGELLLVAAGLVGR
jgi:signal transduction histidine kinase/CheY-like chemotaxis protein